MNTKPLQHLLSIEQLDYPTLNYLLKHAQTYVDSVLANHSILPKWNGKVVTNLFFESSTRTRNSFELAAKRLGAITISPDIETSALSKGESLLDMILTLEAMGSDVLVIRHSQNQIGHLIVPHLKPQTHLINAGDGSYQHPTQALLDLLTIRQLKSSFEDIKVAIVGDIRHSRVARSLIQGLNLMNTGEIRLVAPSCLLPEEALAANLRTYKSLTEGIAGVDVIYCLRLQNERMDDKMHDLVGNFNDKFQITEAALALADSQAIVMHPAPINREVEISSTVAYGPQSAILQQVHNGLAARMAIIDHLLSNG